MAEAIEEREETKSEATPARERLTLLFLLYGTVGGLAVASVLRALLQRGHQVLVAIEHSKEAAGQVAILDALRTEHPNLEHRVLPERKGLWLIPATAVRRRLDHLRSLEPDQAIASPFGERPPLFFRFLLSVPPFRDPSGQRLIASVLRRLEVAMPVPRAVGELIAECAPDRVLLSPLVEPGSAQVDYLRASHRAAIPSVFVVAARDDLTGKGGIYEAPTLTLAWDEAQVDAAVRLHGLPPERVAAGGLADDPSPALEAAAAIERVAPGDVTVSQEGRFLRPALWLLTPLLAILLPLLRPRATARAIDKGARRLAKRARGAWQTRRTEARRRAKLKAHEAKQRERANAIMAKAAAKAEAEEAKRAEKARAEEAKRAEKARAEEAKRAEKTRAEAAKRAAAATPLEAEDGGRIRAAKPEEPKRRRDGAPKAAKPAAKRSKGGGAGLPQRARRFNSRMRKRARGRVKGARRRWKYSRRAVRRVYNRRYRFTYRSTITRVPARDELPALLNARGLLGRGVEIGVKTGLYSNELLTNWHGEKLISIDPWLSADPDEYVDRSNVSQDEFERYYQETRERLSRHGSRSTIWRMTSLEAAPKVADHELDFCYIDARHDYASVLEDLDAWCSKVKPGGILAGHDYVDGDLPQGEFYVKSAVDEFFGARDIPVHSTEGPSVVEMFPTWIVEVPEGGVKPTTSPPSTEATETTPSVRPDTQEPSEDEAAAGGRARVSTGTGEN